ncbi:hypothetical protein [Rubellimicrobium arenae]|uniref:hypothetical protein n=1 Tax=Rubellimicrobium arenae TaxID=2817372 RepID=UPI001B3069C0|nr:hypothetical protein [Rubellimicrobium arenae]
MATKQTDTAAADTNAPKDQTVDQAVDQAITDGAAATEEARKRDEETLRQQEDSQPYPSQEQADALKSAVAGGGLPYATRDAKAK